MAEQTETAGTRALSDEVIVFPAKEFKLLSGETIAVYPWGLEQGALVLQRLEDLQARVAADSDKPGAGWTPRALLSAGWAEVVELVALSCEVEVAEISRPVREGGWAFEDMLKATETVLEVCLLRSDGGGALPLLVSLAGTMTELLIRGTGPASAAKKRAPKRSNGSNGKVTSRGRSRSASGSRRARDKRKK